MKKVSVIGAGALATIFVTQLDRLLKNEYEISCIWNLLKIGTVFRNEWDSKLLRGGTL